MFLTQFLVHSLKVWFAYLKNVISQSICACFSDYMERFLDDQETPPPPVASRERSASPVHSLLYGDPKRGHLKPHVVPGAGGAGDPGALGHAAMGFKPIMSEPSVCTASPTVPCLDARTLNPAADSKTLQQSVVALTNGHQDSVSDEYVPPFKRSKVEFSADLQTGTTGERVKDLQHRTTAATEAASRVDSAVLASVAKVADIPCSGNTTGSDSTSVTRVLDKEPVGFASVEMSHTRSAEVSQ